MRFKNRTTPVVFFAIVLAAFAAAFMTTDERYVAAPGLACIVMILWLWTTKHKICTTTNNYVSVVYF